MTKLGVAPIVVAACALGGLACAAVFGFERLDEAPPATDASPVEDGGPTGLPGACDEGRFQPPAADAFGTAIVESAAPTASLTFHFAARALEFGRRGGIINLDRRCTSDDRTTSSCVTSVTPSDFSNFVRDEDAGVDNAMGGLFPTLGNYVPSMRRERLTESISNGRFGVTFALRGWNGTTEDSSVAFEMYPALGLYRQLADGGLEPSGPPGDNATLERPTFEPRDLWMTDKTFATDLDAESTSREAWVSGGKLIARFNAARLPIRISGDLRQIDVVLNDAWFIGELALEEPRDAGDAASEPRLPVLTSTILAGRWSTKRMLDELRLIYVRDNPGFGGLQSVHLCKPAAEPVFRILRGFVCAAPDLRALGQEDESNLPCDAISVNFGIDTYAIARGGRPFDQSGRYPIDAGELAPELRCLEPNDVSADAGCPLP